jgi:hypothetical protein
MRMIVGTTPQKVVSSGRARPVIQNRGPGTIYIDTQGTVSPDTGLELMPQMIMEFATSGSLDDIYVVSTQAATDVRVIEIG